MVRRQSGSSTRVDKEQVFALLLMRFNIQPSKANLLVTEWLSQHPDENWETLKYLLDNNRVTVSEGLLKDVVRATTPERSSTKYQGTPDSMLPKGSQQLKPKPSVKKRRYRGVEY